MAPAPEPETTIIDGKKYRNVHEGLATVLAPYRDESQPSVKKGRNNDEGLQAVFYNPIQQFNRDLSVLAITVYGEGAVLEKEARNAQKTQQRKNNKGKKRQKLSNPEPANQTANGHEQAPSRKRKADELVEREAEAVVTEASKKARTTDEADDDEDLLVEALSSDPLATQHQQEEAKGQDGTTSDSLQKDAPANENPAPTTKRVPFAILDALSATGLRALRYAKEIPFATNIVGNDLSSTSVQSIDLNIRHNKVEDKVRSNLGDARGFMYSKVGNEQPRHGEGYVHRFDVIDLDPYGTAAPFIDASLQALQDGGMLCVTCTDAGVFASTGYPEKTYALYGGTPTKGPHSHEGGLRLILNAVAVSAARYGLAVEPLLSLYIDYYARLFIRIHRKQQDVKLLAGTSMTVYNCAHGCGAWTTQPLLRNQPQTSKSGETVYKFSFAQAPLTTPNCEHCGSKMHLCGPMWAGPLHNPYFVQKMLDKLPSLDEKVYGTTERLKGMLTLALEEDLTEPTTTAETSPTVEEPTEPESKLIPRLPANIIDNAPFFVIPGQLAKVIHCGTPSETMMRGAILSLGYRVTRSHCKPGSIKTNAPWSVLWEIIREFMRIKAPIKEGAVKAGTPGWNILARARGTERAFVSGLKDGAKDQLARCDTKEDMKTVLQGMLWRLENEKAAGETANGNHEETAARSEESVPQRARSRSPSPVEASKLNIVFDEKLGKENNTRRKLVRYQMNPRENWGPMSRAGRTG
ncbi:RNA methyltransferase tRNA(m5U54)methyltransferase [Elasticomyces elasticus]|uniref:tRNA (guanine(26)-N(2))-dimethyltransferase n=1 Tax=Exophiala sideris TaxID=1016849 RepID=A0ABR0J903_9EURO|nr:RNA methyltransferase tRNA(m5U54)methyltransferase [Elasticomyces elasticus]KAK5027854.1 RNA methyltransferase tRNA(m5U54)methyltransferase [Exophiala sideris]KAK5037557.1 RNA methyltransferase tRNA(m5U54)methyltransferase [Exophiala sideris]KAK5059218.1 RNA methyltransferase tRNA(m5U54)methyltransferase [Exophiala sideris]KAK5183052.1 RNA methyltransferase tRNA(m5U54)methyltransferase [Eurotiomycetes sp. CCFEE 6388]